MHTGPRSEHHIFELDLTAHESHRQAAVMAALGDRWDPVETLRREQEAYDLLYSGLDAEQQRLHTMLVEAGVLPPGEQRASD